MEQKDNSGVLFKNDQKGNDKAPLYRGNIVIGGKKYNLSAWLNESKTGQKYMSLKAEIDTPVAEAKVVKNVVKTDDSMPF